MIANPGNPTPETLPHPFTLNDLRVHNVMDEAPEPTSPLALYGMAAVVVLAIGAFVWMDPLHLFASRDATPPAQDSVSSTAPATVPSTETPQAPQGQETVAPVPSVTATKSAEAPTPPAPLAQAPQVAAPVTRPHIAAAKPESRGTPADKIHTAARKASPEETMAPPVVLSNPEEKSTPPAAQAKPEEKADAPTAAPIVAPAVAPSTPPVVAPPIVAPATPKSADDAKSAPKAPASDQPATE